MAANEFIDLVDDSIRRIVSTLEEVLLEDGIKPTLELRLAIEKIVRKAYREAFIRKNCSLQFLAEIIAKPVIARLYPRKKWSNVMYRILCRLSSDNNVCTKKNFKKNSKLRIW